MSNCAKYMTTIRRELSNLIFYYSIVFNDLLGNYHDKNKYAKIVRDCLNSEWIRVGVGDIFGQQKPYTDYMVSVCSPKVPQKDNVIDCGVFVCRYAYNWFLLKNETFSHGSIDR